MDLSAFNLQGKVALITGGAHGIGFSIAEGMAKCGATICFNCSNEGSLEKGLAAYKAAGIDAHGYVADVSDEDCRERHGGQDQGRSRPRGHSGEQRRSDEARAHDRDEPRRLHARHRRACGRCLQLLQGRSARHDRQARGQDHQHLLHDERAGPRDRVCLRCRQGRI